MSRRHLTLLFALAACLAPSPGLAQAKKDKGKRYALLVGVQEYEHARQFKSLEFAENDARETASELRKAGYSVTLLTSSDEKNPPTLANISRQLDSILKRATKRDLVLIGLAGHGLQFGRKEGSYFCPSDARAHDPKTLLSIAAVYKKLEESPAGVGLLLVDACRDDGSPRGARRGLDGERVPNPPRGVAVLFSCSPDQYAWESPRYRHGVFFHFVLQGLRGKAKDEDGEVTWASLSAYVSKQVARSVPVVIGGGATQEPHEVKNITGPSPVLLRVNAASEADELFRLGEAFALGLGRKMDRWEAARCYRRAAEKGHPLATARLGTLYALGRGVEKDEEKAKELCRGVLGQVRQAAEEGDPTAQEILGVLFHYGIAVGKDPERAVRWIRKAASQGLAEAQSDLGYFYQVGEGVEKDEQAAVKWYRKAAEQGLADAQGQLGYCHQHGKGVERDYKEALRWYRKAAEQGHVDAHSSIGALYETGLGVDQDYEEAVRWYRKAAGQGSRWGLSNLGACYLNGKGVKKDAQEAVRLFHKAAEQGLAEAQCQLGYCHQHGKGVERDYKEALRWYRKAAEQGNALAHNQIGGMCYRGLGVRQDHAMAAKWYREAANGGLPMGQYSLGYLYQHGRGVARDLDEARKWYRKAAAQGNELARKALRELE